MQLAAMFLSILVVAACGESQPATVDAPIAIDASTAPSLAVTLSPTTVAAGGFLTATVTTTNFDVIDPRTGPAVKDGEGHFHYYVDADPVYTAGWTASVTIKTDAGLAPGAHRVRFVLATSAHDEVTPIVDAIVPFTVE